MAIPNQTPPERMTAEQRLGEVASLLAQGLLRLRDLPPKPSDSGLPERKLDLGFCPPTARS